MMNSADNKFPVILKEFKNAVPPAGDVGIAFRGKVKNLSGFSEKFFLKVKDEFDTDRLIEFNRADVIYAEMDSIEADLSGEGASPNVKIWIKRGSQAFKIEPFIVD